MLEIFFIPSSEERPEIVRKCALLVGQPFIELPPFRISYQGEDVPKNVQEMILNDRLMMDWVYSHCKGIPPRKEAEQFVYDNVIAQAKLDATTWRLIERALNGRCIVCGHDLYVPHAESCTVKGM